MFLNFNENVSYDSRVIAILNFEFEEVIKSLKSFMLHIKHPDFLF